MADYLSDLKLGAKLGNGAFGEVFRGEDPAHGGVAIKVLTRKAFTDDTAWPGFKAGFIAEAKNLSKAKHRNVVPVHHVAEAPDGNSVAICMAFCPGGSLQAKYDDGPMTLAAVRKLGTEVLLGLGAMHARGMVHRDVKPANILLDAKGVAQISDFGLVTDELVLGYASAAGYDDHIAFEVWHGKGTSAKSDIWALGMTLYRLLHGKSWYEEGPHPREVVKHGGFADSLRWLPHIPKTWRRVIRKMLNDDPAARYQGAAEVLKAFAHLPVAPTWVTTASPALVRWEQIKLARRLVVEWKKHSPRKHEWEAWSEPVRVGRRMHLEGSCGVVSSRAAIKGLETFFDI